MVTAPHTFNSWYSLHCFHVMHIIAFSCPNIERDLCASQPMMVWQGATKSMTG